MRRPNKAKLMGVPSHIEFQKDSERILRCTLLAVTPQEGCALLIGESVELQTEHKPNVFKLQLIWPCCNIWISGFHDHVDTSLETKVQQPIKTSRENRFALDPYEQLSAQKWARSKNLKVLGAAHSHKASPPIPSETDLSWNQSPNLMIILNANTKEMRAWWVSHPKDSLPLRIPLICTDSK